MAFLPLIGAVVGAASSVMGGIAAKNQADYQAAIANRNAIVAGQEQASAIQVGEEKSGLASLRGASALGRVKTEIAASGVDVNRGSAVDVRASERMANILNAQSTMWNAARSGWGYGQHAIGEEAQAQADKAAGQQAEIQGFFGGAADLFKGIGSVVSPTSIGNNDLGPAATATPVAANNFAPNTAVDLSGLTGDFEDFLG
jgi:hypothetical protein